MGLSVSKNSHLADESNMDVIFCFVNSKAK